MTKATVLPEKQLRHILKKQGYACSGDYHNEGGWTFLKEMFNLCLKELEIIPIENHPVFDFRDEKSRYLFSKDWFIPNSFKE
jgi:hypothetical protein